jgi:hypothetical protein
LLIFNSDDEEDLEGHTSIYWERISGVWLAELDDQGVLYVPKKERIQSDEFLCVSCRTRLEDFIRENGLREDTSCPVCEEPIIAPIAPPR